MIINLYKTLKLFACTVSLILATSSSIKASTLSELSESDEEIYRQGLVHRNAANRQNAIECFMPLAQRGHVKAQHNLAMQYYATDDELEAYRWFKRASEKDFTPSSNNLKKMNLLNLLLPNECLCRIASLLDMASLSSFKAVSRRAHRVFSTTLTSTNFLTSESPFAKEFMSRFSQVSFDPMPHSIRLVRSVKAKESPIIVHFRDPKHLREIVEETPEIAGGKEDFLIKNGAFKDRTYFVKDNSIEDGKEIAALNGPIEKSFLIYITANTPLILKGELKITHVLALPEKTDINSLSFRGKRVIYGALTAHNDGLNLADALETFNEQLFKLRTLDAIELLNDRMKERSESSTRFPDLMDACPTYMCLLSVSETTLTSKDYITAKKPLIYIANSIASLDRLHQRCPEFSKSICYIDPSRDQSGIYCSGPLSLTQGFEISSEGDITIIGEMDISQYNLMITTRKGLWLVGTTLKNNNAIISVGSFYLGLVYKNFSENVKPEKMPEDHWRELIDTYQQSGYFD